MDSTSAPRYLLVQLFSNGDCLYATSVAKQIKQDYPGCSLTWAVAPSCKSILLGNPYVDNIIEITDVPKDDVSAFRKLKKRLALEKKNGLWTDVFITHIMDDNLAYYDGCIRTNILRGYPNPIIFDTTPVLVLSDAEKNKVKQFVAQHDIEKYKYRILFEFAPQSGQLPITPEASIRIAEKITRDANFAVILSSARKIDHPNKNIIDGSTLTLRETAALTFYCTHLIGCSSGITWITTSEAAKQLPMIQLINPYTKWVNPVSRDFERQGKSTEGVIDIIDFSEEKIVDCVQMLVTDFPLARLTFGQKIPLQFNTSRQIVYNLLCYLHFRAIVKHIKINTEVYGFNSSFYKEVLLGIIFSPFKLFSNLLLKKIMRK